MPLSVVSIESRIAWQSLTYRADREIEIAHELGQRILVAEELLGQISDICGELDW